MSRSRVALALCIASSAITASPARAASVGSVALDPDNGACHAFANPPTPAGVATATATGGVSCAVKPGLAITGTITVCARTLEVSGLGTILTWTGPCTSQSFVWTLGNFSGSNASITASCSLAHPVRTETYVSFDNANLGSIENASDALVCV